MMVLSILTPLKSQLSINLSTPQRESLQHSFC
jgi:hypothetical protein